MSSGKPSSRATTIALRERLVDLDPLDFGRRAAGAFERLLDGRDGSEPGHPGLDRRDAPGDETCIGTTPRAAPFLLHQHRRRRPAVQSGALPAVMVPPSRKAAFNAASVSSVVPGLGCSSGLEGRRTLRPPSSMGTNLVLNLPAACAAPNSCCERSAHRSCSSRLT